MENTKLNFDLLIGEKGYEYVQKHPDEFTRLFEKKYSLKELDVSATVLNYWKETGLLPDKPEGKRNHIFNLPELIYLFILQDARSFGMTTNKLIKLKTLLLTEFKLEDILESESFSQILPFFEERYGEQRAKLMIESKDAISELFKDQPLFNNSISTITSLILSLLIEKVDVLILLSSSGDVSIDYDEYTVDELEYEITDKSHLVLPLVNYLSKLISDDKFKDLLHDLKLLSNTDQHLIDQIRAENFEEIIIKFKEGEPELVITKKAMKIDDKARVSEIIMKGGYQDFTIKTNEGKINYASAKTTFKLPKVDKKQ